MTIRHFVTGYDSGINWEEWGVKLYGDGKLIVAAEHLKSNAHVHFHGESQLSDKEWTKQLALFKKDHPIKKIPGGANLRPTKEMKKPADDKGYQYVAKEKHQLYMQGITQEEFEELHASSTEHVEKLKKGMQDHIHAKHYEGTPANIFLKIAADCIRYNRAEGIRLRPQYRIDVHNVMLFHPQATDAWMDYINQRLL